MRWRNVLLVSLVLVLLVLPAFGAQPNRKAPKTEVSYPVAVASSPAFRDLPVDTTEVTVGKSPNRVIPNPQLNKTGAASAPEAPFDVDAVLQYKHGNAPAPSPLINFDGIANVDGVAPPDTQGDIGPDHYLQWVNLHLAAWSINRTTWTQSLAFGPVAGNTIWAGLGGQCASDNDGDPIVLWDRFRSRWVISQFSLGSGAKTAIAVSKTADPTGAWWLYCYDYSPTTMNDYPKFGVWPDGYYYTCNQFLNFSSWGGAGLCVFEADKMINGDPTARQLKIDLGAVSLNYGGVLPAHFEGTNAPPAGSGYFVEVDDSTWMSPPLAQDSISLWKAHVNWTTGTFTVGVGGLPDLTIPVTNFTPLCMGTRSCIPQPPGGENLDAIADRGMYRCQYRNFGSYEAMVFNITVDSGSGVAGIRWFELRKDSGHPDWYLYQEGTYAPADGINRWMGSAAQDHMGDLCIGYSMSNSSLKPAIGYAGRLAGDPAGTLPQSEVVLHNGPGVQNTGYSRWGDYSTISTDPVDDCTFWYTQEYVQASGGWDWATRIGAFKFPACSIGPTGTLSGTVVDAGSLAPISGATVTAVGTVTAAATTGPTGAYTLTLPVDTYNVTASAFGYSPVTVNGIAITNGVTTTQNFSLAAVGSHTMQFNVHDANTSWPLYARIDVTGDNGYPGGTFWTDPVTGATPDLPFVDGVTYCATATPWVPGYVPGISLCILGPLDTNYIFAWGLDANSSTCNAPGYHLDYQYLQDFEAGDGSFVASGSNSSWAYGVPTSGPGGAHSPTHAWATNLGGNYNTSENSYITSPTIDLSAQGGKTIILEWWQWLNCESGYDYASVEASSNGGTTWNVVYGPVSGSIDASWTKHSAVLGTTYATANFRVRFHFTSDSSVNYAGWYVDDVGVGAVTVVPPTFLWTEGFEGTTGTALPAGWAQVDTSGTAGNWATASATVHPAGIPPHAGTRLGYFNSWTASAGNATRLYKTAADDLSSYAAPVASFWMYHDTIYSNVDTVQVQVSTDGGTTWQPMGAAVPRYTGATGWAQHTVALTGISGPLTTVQLGFLGTSGYGNDIHIDDVGIMTDPGGGVPPISCIAPATGGIIVGQVNDANTSGPVTGATVTNTTTTTVVTAQATPDPAVGDAFYCAFANTGNVLNAAKANYGTDTTTAGAFPSSRILTHDFALTAGRLTATPASLEYATPTNATGSQTLTLNNIGAAPVNWTVSEAMGHLAKASGNLFACMAPQVGSSKIDRMNILAAEEARERIEGREERSKDEKIAPPSKDKTEKPEAPHQTADAPRASGTADHAPPAAAPYAAGDVLGSWPSGLSMAWGLAFDANDNTVWVGSPAPSWGGSDTMYEYTPAGTATGRTYPFSWAHSNGPGDFAYNWNTGNIWVMNINTGVSNCIFEVNPATGPTGASICPGGGTGFATSERGIAYDPVTDTFYAGGWNTLAITHFDASGTILGTTSVGLEISGLAYNPTTQHLFAQTNSSPNLIYVLDAANNYAVLGSFAVAGFGDYSGAGLEIDCNGHLWAANQVDMNIYEIDSGEAASLCGIPWLDETPLSGTIAAGGSQDVTVSYDSTGMATGIYLATLVFGNDTPYGSLNVPVTMNVWEPVASGAPLSGQAPVPVAFTGTITNALGAYTYDWDFGDGSPHSTAQNPTHTYNIGGTFTVTFSATDSFGHTASDNHLSVVITAPAAPVVYNFYDDAGRSRLCVNRITGAYSWEILSGPGAGNTYTGTANIVNGGTKIYSKTSDPNYLNCTYDPIKKRASGYYNVAAGPYYSRLTDLNTTNNPAGCY